MIRLTYISTARPGVDDFAASSILKVSQRNNARDAITGLLMFDGKRFLQALEGHEALIERAFDRIRDDPRHFACVALGRVPIEARAFGEWDMAWRRLAGTTERADLAETIDAMVAQVPDPSTRALFTSFSRIDRAG